MSFGTKNPSLTHTAPLFIYVIFDFFHKYLYMRYARDISDGMDFHYNRTIGGGEGGGDMDTILEGERGSL